MVMVPKHPPSAYSDDVELDEAGEPKEVLCSGCSGSIVWGKTRKGRRAPFDLPRDEHGYVNHFITCPDRDDFRRR